MKNNSNSKPTRKFKNKWKDALLNGVTLTEEIKVPFPEDKDYKEIMSVILLQNYRLPFAVLGASLLILQSFRCFKQIGTEHTFAGRFISILMYFWYCRCCIVRTTVL